MPPMTSKSASRTRFCGGAVQSERGLRGEGGGARARLGAAENGQVTLFMLADFVRLQHAPQTFGRGGLGGDLKRCGKKFACARAQRAQDGIRVVLVMNTDHLELSVQGTDRCG